MALGKRKKSSEDGTPWITPGKAKNAIGVAKVIGPVVLPVITPYLVKGASAARDAVERRRARKLGVGVGDLAKYTGRGGPLYARIAGVAGALNDLEAKPDVSAEDRAFVAKYRPTLDKLSAAVRAAERMPTSRRRAAHRAASAEVDQIEQQLLHRLGV